jgi:hypothetical protein
MIPRALDEIKGYIITVVMVAVLAFGYHFLLQHGNTRIEAQCTSAGGTVIRRLGDVSLCAEHPENTATCVPTEVML